MTFGKECAVLDDSLPSGYDDTKWEKPMENLEPKWYHSESGENENVETTTTMAATTILPTTIFEPILQYDAVVIEVIFNSQFLNENYQNAVLMTVFFVWQKFQLLSKFC